MKRKNDYPVTERPGIVLNNAISPTAVITIAIFVAFLALPGNGLSADMQAQPAANLEQEVAQQDMQQGLNPDNVSNIGVGEVDTSEYDVILEVPVQVESLYPVISKFRIICAIGKRQGESSYTFEEGTWQSDAIVVDIGNGSYNGTFRYFFNLLPNQAPEDVNLFVIRSGIWNTETDGWYTPYQGPNPEDIPAWQRMGPNAHSWTFGPIEW